MRQGKISHICKNNMVAVYTHPFDGEQYTTFEILNDVSCISIGDLIEWDSDFGMGHEQYRNKTTNKLIAVYVENHCVVPSILSKQLKNK